MSFEQPKRDHELEVALQKFLKDGGAFEDFIDIIEQPKWYRDGVIAFEKFMNTGGMVKGARAIASKYRPAAKRGEPATKQSDDRVQPPPLDTNDNTWVVQPGLEVVRNIETNLLATRPVVASTKEYTPRPTVDREEEKKNVVALAGQLKRMVLLDQIMLNDKRRGDCTGAELIKFGGFDIALGKLVGPKGTPFGKGVTEDQCWKMMGKPQAA